ncbi:hypothetical protein VTI74DRAFT_4617 [Chaetomium olivicolor]
MPRQHLTPNACLVCRKKRTKCDGQLPCRRCRSRGEECAYEDKKWRTKDHLRSEIERLRAEQRQVNALLQALTNNDPERWQMVLDRMRAGDHPDAIAEWILLHSSKSLSGTSRISSRAFPDNAILPKHMLSPLHVATAQGADPGFSGRHQTGTVLAAGIRRFDTEETVKPDNDSTPEQSTASVAGPPPGSDSSIPSPITAEPLSVFAVDTPCLINRLVGTPRRQHLLPPEILGDPISHTWTRVTNDTQLVQRLLARFFSSPLASLSLVSQRHFMQDFREGNPRYCSEALVNAILAMACSVAATTSQLVSSISFGDAFMGEAKGLLAKEQDRVNLPSIQALGILALAEMAQGNEEEAGDLGRASVKASIRFFLQAQQWDCSRDDDFRVVRALTYCGCLTLVRHLRLLTRDLEPITGPIFMRISPNSGDMGDDAPEARVERGISVQMHFFSQLQYCPPLARFIFEVTEAAHTFSSYNYSHAMTASDLDGAVNKCTAALGQALESGAFETDGGPDVLLAQIWYNFCVLGLLQPFVTDSASLVDGLPPSLLATHLPIFRHYSLSTCFSTDDQIRRPSVCSFASSSTSDRDEPSSVPDTRSNTLPTFTSRPADLVTIGSLQLASMGAQHPGAAEAAQLLRSVNSGQEPTQLSIGPVPCIGQVPVEAGMLNGAPRPPGGVDFHMMPDYGPALSDVAPGPVLVPRSGYGIPAQPFVPPSKVACPGTRRAPPPPLLGGWKEINTTGHG